MHVRTARYEEAVDALDLLLSAMPEPGRRELAEGLANELPREQEVIGGLWVVECGEQLCGVCLAQLHPGKTASIWRPRFRIPEDHATALTLVDNCVQWSVRRGARLQQSLLEIEDESAAAWFAKSGFERIARLAYLVWEAPAQRAADAESELRFQRAEEIPAERFAQLVQASYEGTLDCPALNGVRAVDDVLDGYRDMGRQRPDLWLSAVADEEPVGCLILAEHPAADQCELVYMGVAPKFRGRGYGAKLIAEAQRKTRELGHARLVLAVDLANTPALLLYHRAGFSVWDQRDVYAILSRHST